MEWGTHPSRAIRTPQIFVQIFCAFLRDFGTPIFSSSKTSKKNLRKVCAKMGAKLGAPKIRAPKICAKNRFEHSVCLEDRSQTKKKHTKKFCAKLDKTPAPTKRIQEILTSFMRVLFFPSFFPLSTIPFLPPPSWDPKTPLFPRGNASFGFWTTR